MKNKSWALLFAAVIAACAAVYLCSPGKSSGLAGIYKNGELLQVIDLNAVTKEYTIDIGGENTALVSPGSICMKSAACPDGVCIAHGPLEKGGTPIICLPNQVVIKWIDPQDEGYDAVAGAEGTSICRRNN